MSDRNRAILESDSEEEEDERGSSAVERAENDDDEVQQEAVDPESPDPEPDQEEQNEGIAERVVQRELDEDDDEDSDEDEAPIQRPAKSQDSDDQSSDDEDESEGEDEVQENGDKKLDDDDEEEEEDADDNGGLQLEGDEEEDDDDRQMPPRNTTLYDFDIMMAKKKEENSKKRKRRNYDDIINDNDDIIADIINQMKDAVEADSEANKNKVAATRKLKLLPFVISQLRKVDLRDAFLDSDVLSVITEWLAPLPDRSLPHLNIRENLLKILIDFNLYDVDRIKGCGIGKAVMYLYKHPKETRENKLRAKQLISSWSRPIFQLDSSFNSISREEREQRDLELMSKQRRASKQHDSSDGEGGPSSSSGGQRRGTKEEGAQKPGDKGWIPRARVPAPSMRDYVIRPRSKVDGDIGKSSKRPANMLEKYMKNQQERRRAGRQQRAINMKIDRV